MQAPRLRLELEGVAKGKTKKILQAVKGGRGSYCGTSGDQIASNDPENLLVEGVTVCCSEVEFGLFGLEAKPTASLSDMATSATPAGPSYPPLFPSSPRGPSSLAWSTSLWKGGVK